MCFGFSCGPPRFVEPPRPSTAARGRLVQFGRWHVLHHAAHHVAHAAAQNVIGTPMPGTARAHGVPCASPHAPRLRLTKVLASACQSARSMQASDCPDSQVVPFSDGLAACSAALRVRVEPRHCLTCFLCLRCRRCTQRRLRDQRHLRVRVTT